MVGNKEKPSRMANHRGGCVIHFVSLHEGTDTSTPNGRLVFGIFASIAEFERQLIIARTKSGMEAARKRGKHIGRPFR
jgi:DNA invertase Pin-like site-specific DNA recombinase